MRSLVAVALAVCAAWSEQAFAGGSCEGTTQVRVIGLDAKHAKVFVSAITSSEWEGTPETEVEASLAVFELKKAPKRKVLWSASAPGLVGAALRTKFDLKRAAIVATDDTLKEAPAENGKNTASSKSFSDGRGLRSIVVEKIQKKKSAHFELSMVDAIGEKTVLNRDLLKGVAENQSGIELPDSVYFAGEYLVGLTRYCGTPIVWSQKITSYPK